MTSIVDVWIAGYDEPGFWFTGTTGFAGVAEPVPGSGVGPSRRGVADGVADFDTADESAEEGLCGSCRKLVWRG